MFQYGSCLRLLLPLSGLLLIGCHRSEPAPVVPASPAVASVPTSGIRLTASQAVTVAQAFCKAAHIPVVTGQAAFPAHRLGLSRLAPLPDTYWQPRWAVHLGRNEIEVVDATSIVTKFFAFDTFKNGPAGKAIPRSQALSHAFAIIQAAGVKETLGSPEIQEVHMTSPPQRDSHLWSIVYPRTFQGYTVARQQITVMLQAETGELKALGVTFPTPPPAPNSPKITPVVAQATSAVTLKQIQGMNFLFRHAQLEWVKPNGQTFSPSSRGTEPSRDTPGVLRLVWDCQFTDNKRSFAEVWVDAETGKMVGGEIASI